MKAAELSKYSLPDWLVLANYASSMTLQRIKKNLRMGFIVTNEEKI